jgi:hypothetical protein
MADSRPEVNMTRAARKAILNVALVGLTGCNSGSSSDAASAPIPAIVQREAAAKAGVDWTPDPRALEELGPAVDIQGYQIRPPKDYAVTAPPPVPKGSKAFTWRGPRRIDGTAPDFMITVVTLPPVEAHATIDQNLAQLTSSFRRKFPGLSTTGHEYGRINGLKFARTYWTAVRQGVEVHGILYTGVDDNKRILFISQDIDPHYDRTAKLVESALMTLRKADPAK